MPLSRSHFPFPSALLPPSVIADGRVFQFPKGAFLYRPPEVLEFVFILRQGLVKLGSYSLEGDPITYDIAQTGEFCGNLKYLGGLGKFQEFAQALTDVEALAYDLKTLKAALKTDSDVHEWFIRLMVGRWARSEARLFSIASLSPEQRLHKLLEELVVAGLPSRRCLTQADLADLTGLSRQTVARLLRKQATKTD